MKTIRVLLVDDHAIVRRGLRSLLESEPDIEIVAEVGTVKDAKLAGVEHRPDIALIDTRLSDGSGAEIIHHLRGEAPEVRALVLSAFDDEQTVTDAFVAGAAGYALKQIDPETLLTGIRDVAAGRSMVDPAVAARMMTRMRRPHDTGPTDQLGTLTPREMRILELIGEGMTNRQIGERLFLSEKTIKNNVTSLLSKLDVQRRTQAATLLARLRS